MARVLKQPARPHGREEWEYVRAGRGGAYWLRPDGLMVRVAAAEREQNSSRVELETEDVRFARALSAVFGR